MLSWAKQFNIFCFLDNEQYSYQPHGYECLLAAGVADSFESETLMGLDLFLAKHPGWVFGHLSYTLKNSIHFASPKKDRLGFPPVFLFVPELLLLLKKEELTIVAPDPHAVYWAIEEQALEIGQTAFSVRIQRRLTKEQYVEKVKTLQEHIRRGDCYEINFCQEFYGEGASIEPFSVFEKLMQVSPNPFSAFYRIDDRFLLCASPERFLQKTGSRILSQPIKGTIGRNLRDPADDRERKEALYASAKDRSENVMVVDLVRNDLTRICKEGTVGVDELFGIYSYPQVHQMISTVSGEMRSEVTFSEIIESTFPMGSMTGAPKHRVMQLIDQYEEQSRGIFSGSVGYISPDGDFDFNVVIRSIMYHESEAYLSYQVGSGITFYSDPGQEWEECLLKAEAIREVLDQG